MFFQESGDASGGESSPKPVQKQRLASFSRRRERQIRSDRQPVADCKCCVGANNSKTFASSLSADLNRSTGKVKIPVVEVSKFAHPDSRRIHQLEDCSVSEVRESVPLWRTKKAEDLVLC